MNYSPKNAKAEKHQHLQEGEVVPDHQADWRTSKVLLRKILEEIPDSGFGPHAVGGRALYCGWRIAQ